MVSQRIRAVMEAYLANCSLTTYDGYHDEQLKWKAVRTFQENWDPDADNWTEMLAAAFRDLPLLGAAPFTGPAEGLVRLSELPGLTEDCLRPLFQSLFSSDDGDLDARMIRANFFLTTINTEISSRFPDHSDWLQTPASVLCLLSLWRPEENYFFLYPEADAWVKNIGFNGTIAPGDGFSLPDYYRMCDEILQAMRGFPQIMQANRYCRETELPDYDDLDQIAVYDLIHCCHAYDLYRKAELRPLPVMLPSLVKEIEEMDRQLKELNDRLEALKEPAPVPDLMGAVIHHSRWGDGTVVNMPGPSIWVQFPHKLHKTPRDSFLRNPAVSLDIPYLEVLEHNRTREDEYKKVLRKRDSLAMEQEIRIQEYEALRDEQ